MILTIRTDKPESEIGLFENGRQIAYEKWQAHRQLAETIHIKINDLLNTYARGRTPSINGIVVYKGPGSFTGLRIGYSVANAIAYSLDVPIVSAGGEKWLEVNIKSLQPGKYKPPGLPDYGMPATITTPKK